MQRAQTLLFVKIDTKNRWPEWRKHQGTKTRRSSYISIKTSHNNFAIKIREKQDEKQGGEQQGDMACQYSPAGITNCFGLQRTNEKYCLDIHDRLWIILKSHEITAPSRYRAQPISIWIQVLSVNRNFEGAQQTQFKVSSTKSR